MFEISEHLLNKTILHLSQGPCYYIKIKICKKVLFLKLNTGLVLVTKEARLITEKKTFSVMLLFYA